MLAVLNFDYSIKSIYPYQVGIVTSNTTLLMGRRSGDTDCEDGPQSPMDNNSCSDSNISVVREIITRVVMPVAHPHSSRYRSVRLKGLLLVGPPGVGKTYAVRAAKHLCKSICDVRRNSLSCSTIYLQLDDFIRSHKCRSESSMLTCRRFCRMPILSVCWEAYSTK